MSHVASSRSAAPGRGWVGIVARGATGGRWTAATAECTRPERVYPLGQSARRPVVGEALEIDRERRQHLVRRLPLAVPRPPSPPAWPGSTRPPPGCRTRGRARRRLGATHATLIENEERTRRTGMRENAERALPAPHCGPQGARASARGAVSPAQCGGSTMKVSSRETRATGRAGPLSAATAAATR